MRKPRIGICPEGAPIIGATAFSALIFSILGWWPCALLFWLFGWFSLHFFRDPERVTPSGKGLAVSPADGRVIKIETRPDPGSGEQAQCICVFMNVFNVHVNRAPVACEVRQIIYFPGKFFNASLDKASSDNERCAWRLVDNAQEQWTMVQIAGLIARRIVCRAEEGDRLARGQSLGMIRFGSRVDLYLPPSYVPAVRVGDKVFGAETVIARKK